MVNDEARVAAREGVEGRGIESGRAVLSGEPGIEAATWSPGAFGGARSASSGRKVSSS